MSAGSHAELVAADGSRVDRRVLVDPSVYDAERERIFGTSWQYVAHESQLTRSGQFVASSMGPYPVVVARGADGQLHVSLNHCVHRGVRVCRADRGTAERFRCPNHGWTYGLDGTLVSVPQERGYGPSFEFADHALLPAIVDTHRGLVFATFDHDAPSLSTYLGDITYYLDVFLDRSAAGTELLPGVQRWVVPCNWKLLPENLSADLYHAPTSHVSHGLVTGADTTAHLDAAWQVAVDGGHSACIRFVPHHDMVAEVLEPIVDGEPLRKELDDFLERDRLAALDRLGAERAGLNAFTGSLFPNFSYVPSLFTIRTARPLGPATTEISSWCIVPADCPRSVKDAMRRAYTMTFGPAGLVEQEDITMFTEMSDASSAVIDDRPFHVGMGLDDEPCDLGLPGIAAGPWSEHNMRGYWRAWRAYMAPGEH